MRASGCFSLILRAASRASSASIVSACVLVRSFKPTVYVVISFPGDPSCEVAETRWAGTRGSGNEFYPDRRPRHVGVPHDRPRSQRLKSQVENIGCRPMFQNHEPAPLMTSIAELLTQKHHLLSRLEEQPAPNERGEIERLLRKVDAELNTVDRPDRL